MTAQTINDQTRSKQKSTKTKPKNPSKQQNPPKNRTQTISKPLKPKTTQTTKNNYLTAPRARPYMIKFLLKAKRGLSLCSTYLQTGSETIFTRPTSNHAQPISKFFSPKTSLIMS
jgi:hypothetical protein